MTDCNAPTLAYVGNPINLASGNKFQRETDYRGKGEFPLVLERSYNSLLSHENSTLGAGWQHNYDRRISEQEAVWQQHYQYDRLNNITGIERTENHKGKPETQQQQFSYDPVQRLIRDRGKYGEQQFTYDKVGNRLSHVRLKQQPALNDDSYADSQSQAHREDYNYAPASNRLLGTSEKQILLDQGGNLLHESSDRNRAYNYNAQNRISEYVESGQLKARYHYNALGQRIHKAVIQNNGIEKHTLFHYGQQGELLGETHLAGNDESSESGSSQNIVWLQMRPVVALDSSANSTSSTNSKPADTQISWLHSDHLLTACAATDANQNRIWRWHSDAFGVGEAESFTAHDQNNQSNNKEAFTLNLRFPGQYHDAESGLHYNYHRTYDPSMGRYTQSDPIGLMGGVNTFGYVEGSPLLAMDPLGLEIFLRTHSVAFGNNHAKIVIIPYDQDAWVGDPRFPSTNRTEDGRVYATLGAGPEGTIPGFLGRLIADENRIRDVNLQSDLFSLSITGDSCLSSQEENALIEKIFLTHESYGNNLEYALFPSASDSTFNSNSYISGLLQAIGHPVSQPPNTPGFELPVSIEEFVLD